MLSFMRMPVWGRWRRDEPDSKGKGPGRSLDRAVNKYGQPLDFLRTEQRDTEAALRLLKKASRQHGVPETSTIDGSDAKAAASTSSHAEQSTPIAIRQVT
jgi:putative transposase